MALINGETLTDAQKLVLRVFEAEVEIVSVCADILSHAQRFSQKAVKKRRMSVSLECINGTTNLVERLFS